ncbi:biotin carboxyl carrier protein [Clostridium pascui]|uniref:biotin/lipoyl-containing protein n=1 Tax=Clostridium pascui TaxID=46609 RepID=UPI0019562181|nr:biotin/lipoyl-containing protein [Clostridium pascui]MBM7869678.1 biotin carboxyl carrier protein [Clostridium pascui]
MNYIITVDNKKYEVEIINSTTEKVTNNVSKETIKKTSTISELLKSPMPGTIIDIKVSLGDNVKKGSTLFILEAMKMENEIAAPKDGIIKEIQVAKGSSVNTSDILAVIE